VRNRWIPIVCSVVFLGCRATSLLRSGSAPAAPPARSASSASAAFKAFALYTDKTPRHSHYVPSGYMGDSDLTMSGAYTNTPTGEGPCLRVNYHATGPKGWAGIYWQDPANNWGDVPGKAGYDLRGASRLSFWARGETGGERVHEFRVGGIVGQYPDSDVATLSNIRLTREWKKYSIDLGKKDLRHIIGGFGFFVNKAESPGGSTFYLDDLLFEAAEGSLEPARPVSALTGQPPAATAAPAPVPVPSPPLPVAPPPPPVPAAGKDLEVKQEAGGLKVSFSSRLMFSSGQAILAPGSGKILDQLVTLLGAYPTNRVLIEGHTDSAGKSDFNLRLSELRAEAVRDYLLKKGGYDASRFRGVGFGDTKPMADNKTAAGRALNRRVEVTILKDVAK
jgi:outer membrane protein OmpA-like peptidoglycan-associated protein